MKLRLFFIAPLLVALCCGLTGCRQKETQNELYSRLHTGVVVVLNRYYYQIGLPGGGKLYFSGLDADGNLVGLTDDPAEVEPAVLTGTGFFVDDRGSIMTNRHVAQPIIDPTEVRKNMIEVLRAIKMMCGLRMAELSEAYDALEQQKRSLYAYAYYGGQMASQAQLSEIQRRQDELRQAYVQLQEAQNSIDSNLDPSAMPITPVCQLGIAYSDTYVTDIRDFLERNPCTVSRVSEKSDVDLALLQLKTKQTPPKAHVFTLADSGHRSLWQQLARLLPGHHDAESVEMGQQLYMIGYNAGLVLANTRRGIKAQMTGGKVTQLSDGRRLLYSIPSLQGSSGSPVVDEWGNLVAVNFAKLGNTDNFNFGIPAEQVRDFLNR